MSNPNACPAGDGGPGGKEASLGKTRIVIQVPHRGSGSLWRIALAWFVVSHAIVAVMPGRPWGGSGGERVMAVVPMMSTTSDLGTSIDSLSDRVRQLRQVLTAKLLDLVGEIVALLIAFALIGRYLRAETTHVLGVLGVTSLKDLLPRERYSRLLIVALAALLLAACALIFRPGQGDGKRQGGTSDEPTQAVRLSFCVGRPCSCSSVSAGDVVGEA